MLTCVPSSVFSWNFRVIADERELAEVTFDFLAEQGTIRHRGQRLMITKHGPMSGHWSLAHEGQPLAEAYKPLAFQRRFELQTSAGPLVVEAKSTFGRSFELSAADGRIIGEIRPTHLFTRQAVIDCDASVAERDQLFAFWLVALSWRRQANSD